MMVDIVAKKWVVDALDPSEIERRLDEVVLKDEAWRGHDRNTRTEPVRSTNWASQIGYECARRLYYERAAASKKAPFSLSSLRAMREGKRHEEAAKRDLEMVGYRWDRAQERVYIARLNTSGKIEGYLIDERSSRSAGMSRVLSEIKSMDKMIWPRFLSFDALLASRWYASYLHQLNAYLAGCDEPVGLFINRNRGTGQMAFLYWEFDCEMFAADERKTKIVEDAIDAKEPPACVEDTTNCPDCPFVAHCGPDLSGGAGVKFALKSKDEEIARIARLVELDPLVTEYKELDDWKRRRFGTAGHAEIVGPFTVMARPAGKGVRVTIRRTGDGENY